jgi:hypothetical protein
MSLTRRLELVLYYSWETGNTEINAVEKAIAENPNEPREYDVVLGNKVQPPIDGVVLGGIQGVKKRLGSTHVEVRIAAITKRLLLITIK